MIDEQTIRYDYAVLRSSLNERGRRLFAAAQAQHGYCEAVAGMQIDQGHHGDTRLDGLRFVGIFRWPGAIHEGNGEAAVVIDERATQPQREALLRILTGQDTEPGASIFQVFSTMLVKLHDPIFAAIDFEADINARKGRWW